MAYDLASLASDGGNEKVQTNPNTQIFDTLIGHSIKYCLLTTVLSMVYDAHNFRMRASFENL